MAMLFLACTDSYKRVGEEAKQTIYPQGVAKNFTLTYTASPEALSSQEDGETRLIAVLTSDISEDYDHLLLKYRTFPEGLQVDFYDEKGNKSVVTADYGVVYSATNVINLQGNVVLRTHDGNRLETPQLYWDRDNEWVFTQESFVYTNEKEGTRMPGVGMDFSRDFTVLNAHKTGGTIAIKEE